MAVRSIHNVRDDQYLHVWDNSVPPVLTVRPNEPVTLQTRDAGNNQIKPGDGVESVVNLDFSRVNPISGPSRSRVRGRATCCKVVSFFLPNNLFDA